MMFENDEERFNEWLRDEAQSYNVPGPAPRDALWARIAAERQRRARKVIELKPWLKWPLAVAALLALGIGIGRWTALHEATITSTPIAVVDSARGTDVVYQVTATQYLSRTEAFLTDVRADLRAGRSDVRFAGQARDLLATTRLLLDSPVADDAHQRALLEDLELVLVQISQYGTERNAHDADLITQGMDQRNVLPKLRSAIPAGPVPVRTQGVL